jgi:hypothetical protein
MTSLVITLSLAVAAPVPKDDKAEREFREKVDAAREKAVAYLKKSQGKDGDWEAGFPALAGMKGGPTALATLALLEAGVPANDPAVAKAVAYLAKLEPEKTYVVGLRTQVLARADAKKYATEIQANADWLLEKALYKGGKLTGWSYPINAIADNSNTHLAIMGLHAAAQAGAKVDAEIWKKIRDYYAATQSETGGWTYHNAGDRAPSHSMTLAGLLGLAVAVKHDKNAKGQDAAFDKGMKALLGGKLGDFGDGKSWFYSWMTAAELGRALGSNEFKSGNMGKAWYRDGAEQILKTQQEDGSLRYAGKRVVLDKDWPVLTTAFGLYVLGPPVKR